ncbi:MAG: S16 family serine protease [Candidatus Woesearchaeota archaeon]
MQICPKGAKMRPLVLLLFFLLQFIILTNPAHALLKQASIPVLALTEKDGKTVGTVAELHLEVRDGSERVFLETIPLTKISTQISMRFAQQVVCRELDLDCSRYDFIFTLKGPSGIVGGPSAGAAGAVLIAATLKDMKLDNRTAITGTINSGGIIGPVGGLSEKIFAASKAGLSRVLIPKGEGLSKDENETKDLFELGRKLNVSVIEVATLAEALSYFTGLKPERPAEQLVIHPAYLELMSQIAFETCERAEELSDIAKRLATSNKTALLDSSINFTTQAKELLKEKAYYSAASYCFRANTNYKTIILGELGLAQFFQRMREARSEIEKLGGELKERNVTTLVGLQAFFLAKERLVEAFESLDEIEKRLSNGTPEPSELASLLAYIEERIYSAITWSRFFQLEDRKVIEVEPQSIAKSCQSKMAEAEEREAYASSLFVLPLSTVHKDIEKAANYAANGEYELCIFAASKAKAGADMLISTSGISLERAQEFIEQKLEMVRGMLVKAQRRGFIPIISYSYYDYAQTLKSVDIGTALLFAELAQELSVLDSYFEKRAAVPEPIQYPPILPPSSMPKLEERAKGFFLGFALGLVLAGFVWLLNKHLAAKGFRKKKKRTLHH